MECSPEQPAPVTPQPPIQQQVPYSNSVLVLGILAIVGCFCWGIPGTVCGIVALTQSVKGKAAYNLNPGIYSEGSLKNLNSGRICAIIGLCLSGMVLIGIIIEIFIIGLAGTFAGMPWHSFMR